ncbi:MAG: hypothetical protein Ct9H300mP5_1710 [Candidatus Pelagibacterales bacterium]|nr:MAG: hypothetical protein Ct9H300mP5_1710 [Pelagibacterales bacterium]
MDGLGNDFVIIDLRDKIIKFFQKKKLLKFVKKLYWVRSTYYYKKKKELDAV